MISVIFMYQLITSQVIDWIHFPKTFQFQQTQLQYTLNLPCRIESKTDWHLLTFL